MLAQTLQRLPWQLVLATFATLQVVHADNIVASNSSAGEQFDYAGQIILQNDGNNITELVPLSREATSKALEGNLYLTTDTSYTGITEGDIAYIDCDPYPGIRQARAVFESAYNTDSINGAVFYSTTSNFCVIDNITDVMQNFPMYSMNSTDASQNLTERIMQTTDQRLQIRITPSEGLNTSDGQQNTPPQPGTNPNPLGPSPSTAVAMIILYSITGIITALFLVIIVTGAVRAHRHPDRYGPRDVLGRPRQSRARGLGRAILDTLPIVKFGQTEDQPKPTDVELGSTSEARDVNGTGAGAAPGTQNADGTTETRDSPATDGTPSPAGEQHSMESGISAAQPTAVAGAAATHTEASSDEGLGCSICTDDFEQGQDIRVLPCNHKFHPECVDPWLLNVSGTCPLCRVDLRPVTSHSSTDSTNNPADPDHLAPPLHSDADLSRRRRSVMRDILSFRSRPDASADERISALRRLREQRRNRSEEGVNASSEDVADRSAARRSKRLSMRLSGVFTGRRRGREESPPAETEAESSAAGAAGTTATTARDAEGSRDATVSPPSRGSETRPENEHATTTRPAEEPGQR